MAGTTNAMHFCGLPILTLAAKAKLSNWVHHTAILYGADEYRLFRAALAIEKVMQQSPADGIRFTSQFTICSYCFRPDDVTITVG